MAVSSYAKGTTSSGEVRLLKDLDTTLDGKNVVIVEDIVDTGLTLTYLQDILRARNPRTLPAGQTEGSAGRRWIMTWLCKSISVMPAVAPKLPSI